MKLNQMFKCECGAVLEVANGCECQDNTPPACCGKPMALLTENTVDAAKEKHVPVIEKIPGGYKVTVGSVLHPMEEKHYITWIQLITEDMSLMKFLKPGDQPVAEFKTDAAKVTAREYCNLHGLWKATV